MKFKLDENLPAELAEILTAQGHDVHTVGDESLIGRPDGMLFQAATDEQRILLTQDLDFSDVRKFKPGTHSGVILIRLRHPSRQRLLERFKQIVDSEPIETWSGCFVVLSDRKLRVRRP